PAPTERAVKAVEAPRTEMEAKLVEIWKDVLGVDHVGVTDHFFAIGGHSLKAISLAARIYKAFQVSLPIRQIFEHPTIRELSQCIKRTKSSKLQQIRPADKQEYYPVTFAQKR